MVEGFQFFELKYSIFYFVKLIFQSFESGKGYGNELKVPILILCLQRKMETPRTNGVKVIKVRYVIKTPLTINNR